MNHAKPGRRLLLLLAALCLSFIVALCAGRTWLTPLGLWSMWWTGAGDADGLALDLVRIPRVLASVGAGAALALSGALLQRLTRNPLADPGLLGLNGGASLGVVSVLVSYARRDLVPPWLLPFGSAAGAIVAATCIAALVWGRRTRDPAVVLLVGVAVSAVAAAAAQSMAIMLDPGLLRWVTSWQIGTLAGIAPGPAWFLAGLALAGIPLALCLAPELTVVGLGDDLTRSLGVKLDGLRRRTLLLAAVLGAAPTAWCGGLAFIGFLAPHLARSVVGDNLRGQLCGSALCGALLLLGADTLGRSLLGTQELPAGALLGVVGVPVFLVVLARWGTVR
jgi:iron complex transport system permease protein